MQWGSYCDLPHFYRRENWGRKFEYLVQGHTIKWESKIQIQVVWIAPLCCLKNHREGRGLFVLLWNTRSCFNKIRAYYVPVSLHIQFPVITILKFELFLFLFPSYLLLPPLSHFLSPFSLPLFPSPCPPSYMRQSNWVSEMLHHLTKTSELINSRSVIWTYFNTVWLVRKSEFFLLHHTAYNSEIS